MKSKKGISSKVVNIILILSLIVVFAVIIIPYSTGTGQKVTEAINTKIMSKIGGLESIPLPQIIKSKFATGKVFDAVIKITPEPPACIGETLELSAVNSKIPAGLYLTEPGGTGVFCKWDLDIATDSNGNGMPDDDIDSRECVLLTDKVSNNINGTEVKLTIQVTGETEGSGSFVSTIAKVNTTIACACDTPTCLYKLTGLKGQLIKDKTISTLELPKNISVKGVHINTTVEVLATSNTDVRLDVGSDGTADWCGQIDKNSNVLIVSDPSRSICPRGLASSINTYLAGCKTDICNVPITWYTSSDLKIRDAHIPYTIKVLP